MSQTTMVNQFGTHVVGHNIDGVNRVILEKELEESARVCVDVVIKRRQVRYELPLKDLRELLEQVQPGGIFADKIDQIKELETQIEEARAKAGQP